MTQRWQLIGRLSALTLTAAQLTQVRPEASRGISLSVASSISVRDFGAKGDGRTDDSPAVQMSIDQSNKLKLCITFPPGTYRLSAPIKLRGGECLKGERGWGPYGSTILLPETAAFVTADPLAQMQSVSISDFTFQGGTNAIDLGLFHQVSLHDVICQDQSGWCLSHVRGERHEIRNIFCWHRSIMGRGCLSFADSSNSIFAATYSDAHWKDEWWDRSIIENVTDIGNGPEASDQYTLWSNGGALNAVGAFSNSNVRLVLSHNTGRTSPIRMFNVQLSEFHNIATDGVGVPEKAAPVIFDVQGFFKYSALEGFYPAFSGNSHWTTALYFRKLFLGSTVRNCSLGGDNKLTFGLRVGQDAGSFGEIAACDGAYYNESPNKLWRNQISIVGCNFNFVNSDGNIILTEKSNSGASISLMADGNGARPATSSFQVVRAAGNGVYVTDFSLGAAQTSVRLPLSVPGGIIEPSPTTPTSSRAACVQGSIRWNNDFLYVCTSPNTWKRSSISAF